MKTRKLSENSVSEANFFRSAEPVMAENGLKFTDCRPVVLVFTQVSRETGKEYVVVRQTKPRKSPEVNRAVGE